MLPSSICRDTHDAFLQSISGLSEKQWRFKPAPDRWSVAEVAEHITVAESGAIFGIVQKQVMTSPAAPEKRAEVEGKDELILAKVPTAAAKAQAPEFLKPTNRWANRRGTDQGLRRSAQRDHGIRQDDATTTCATTSDRIPCSGPLDGYQWILLISCPLRASHQAD